MMEHGLRLIGHRILANNRENLANFRQAYGASPQTAAAIWIDLRDCSDDEVSLEPTAKLDHLFWTFHFLRVYPKQRNMTAVFGSCSKTMMYWIKHYIYKIAMLKNFKVINYFAGPFVCLYTGFDSPFVIVVKDYLSNTTST